MKKGENSNEELIENCEDDTILCDNLSKIKIKNVSIMIMILVVSFLFFGLLVKFNFSSSEKVFENMIQWGMSAEAIENVELTSALPSSTKNEKVYEGALVEGLYLGDGLTTYMLNDDKLYQVNIAIFTDDDMYKDVANSLDQKFTKLYGEGNYSLSDRSWYTEKTKITILKLSRTFVVIYKDITVDF